MNKHRDAAYEIPDGLRCRRLVLTAARSSVGRGARARREARLPQRAGDGARADRHDRAADGLRHHRHRARPRAQEDQEARRRRHDVDRQPDGAARASASSVTTKTQVADIVAYIDENSHVIDAPHLREEHMTVFDTAMGERSIQLHGAHQDDGGGPAVPLGRDLQDRQPARERHRRGRRAGLRRGLAARAQGARALPRQLQGRSAAVQR